MRRIIEILVLSVMVVVLSGCEKIKTELERRHLASETHKSASPETINALKTPAVNHPVNQRGVKTVSERKQIIFRIDLPANDKIQIRLIKNPVVEEGAPDAIIPPGNVSKETPSLKDEASHAAPDPPAELEQKSQSKQPDAKDEESKSEMKSDTEPEAHSEMKTDSEEAFPSPPVFAPTVFIPARETTSQPEKPDMQVQKNSGRPEPSEPTPAEKAVGLALSVSPPETILPASSRAIKAAPKANAESTSSPWALPDAQYPLRYY